MSRIDKIRARIREMGLDAVLIIDELNAQYATNFAFSDGMVLITLSEAHLLTDFRYYEAAVKAAGARLTVTKTKERTKYIADRIAALNLGKIGFEGECVPYSVYKSLCGDHPTVSFEDIGDMLDKLRAVKDSDEILSIARAQEFTDAAYSALLNKLTPDMTETEVAAEIDYLMRRAGADGCAFNTIAVSGAASSLPHGTPRNVKLERGFLTMDFGAKYNGYCSDMTRTVSIGKADDEMKHLYSTVLRAQTAALEFLRAGVDCAEADAVARDIIDSFEKYKECFGHSLGHSIGLNVHEPISVSPKGRGKYLVSGNVVSVEPGIYLYGKYGCRIEDMVLIENEGIRNFTKSAKELIEIY